MSDYFNRDRYGTTYAANPITETDIDTTSELYDELEQQRLDWEYWEEVRNCCGGTDWYCQHYRSYPPTRSNYDD